MQANFDSWVNYKLIDQNVTVNTLRHLPSHFPQGDSLLPSVGELEGLDCCVQRERERERECVCVSVHECVHAEVERNRVIPLCDALR